MAKLPKKTLPQLIDAVTLESYPRPHLGASIIGHPCKRKTAYTFYWTHTVKVPGRLERIFRLGDAIEDQIINALATVGITVKGSQTRVVDSTGHAGGSTDGIIPDHPDFEENILFEAKSANHNNFLEIKRKGVQDAKPTHYTQMNMYMGRLGLKFALYGLYNKNNSELHFEQVPFDEEDYKDAINTEHDILHMGHINEFVRISSNPSWYLCKDCDAKDICHGGEAPAKTCRTCERSEMHVEGKWWCSFHEKQLTLKEQQDGCHHYGLDAAWK